MALSGTKVYAMIGVVNMGWFGWHGGDCIALALERRRAMLAGSLLRMYKVRNEGQAPRCQVECKRESTSAVQLDQTCRILPPAPLCRHLRETTGIRINGCVLFSGPRSPRSRLGAHPFEIRLILIALVSPEASIIAEASSSISGYSLL